MPQPGERCQAEEVKEDFEEDDDALGHWAGVSLARVLQMGRL